MPKQLRFNQRRRAGNFNLDLKNPHNSDEGPGGADTLLPEYESLLQQIADTRGQLKAQLEAVVANLTAS